MMIVMHQLGSLKISMPVLFGKAGPPYSWVGGCHQDIHPTAAEAYPVLADEQF